MLMDEASAIGRSKRTDAAQWMICGDLESQVQSLFADRVVDGQFGGGPPSEQQIQHRFAEEDRQRQEDASADEGEHARWLSSATRMPGGRGWGAASVAVTAAPPRARR